MVPAPPITGPPGCSAGPGKVVLRNITELLVAMSGLPSPLKSAMATTLLNPEFPDKSVSEKGLSCVAKGRLKLGTLASGAEMLVSTDTAPPLSTTTSALLSPLKSAIPKASP